jgi:carbon-monoxide dehydrogenase medium subunit
MKPAPFDYIAPATISAALATLAEAGGGATVIAGGQTLMPLLNLRMSQPFILVDINKTAGMTGITHSAAGTRIGAATRQAALLTDPELAEKQPVLVAAAGHIGHHQTRSPWANPRRNCPPRWLRSAPNWKCTRSRANAASARTSFISGPT